MAGKQSGLGDNLYIGGYDISGDTNSLSAIRGGIAPIDVTGINKSAHERLGGLHDGNIDWVSYFNNANTSPFGAHHILATLPRTDTGLMYMRSTAIGAEGACLQGKQINYDLSRTAAGDLTFKVQAQANGFGLEWGKQLTAGIRTDVAATNGTSFDFNSWGGASTAFGWQAYLQVFGFTGTDATVTLQDSADNTTFANLSSGAFVQITAGRQTQRLAVGGTAAVRRYVRAITSTTGGFTSLAFAVVFMRNIVAVQF